MMATDPFEIPEQMRTFAETSVEHAKKAFDDYVKASRAAVETMETQAEAAQSRSRGIGTQAMSFAEANVSAAMTLATQVIHAKSPAEIMEIQKSFMESQTKALSEQAREMGEIAQSMAKDVADTVSDTVSKAKL